jgi:hypothetical protein
MPSESRFNTESPLFGTYVAKRWSNERFSPTMTITCLMGVAVLESPARGFLAAPAKAGVMLGPKATVSVSNSDINFLRWERA